MTRNRLGLTRHIPEQVRREVRKRSKFGCILCRSAIYTYEHIDPEFHDAALHDPDSICCLCWYCHDLVTRGHYSKKHLEREYKKIQAKDPWSVPAPRGPVNFFDEDFVLRFGGITYPPGPRSIFRFLGSDIIYVVPGNSEEPAKISAKFFDPDGNVSLIIDNNEWIGRTDIWDIVVQGSRISIKNKNRKTALCVRLDQNKNALVIESLEMRLGSYFIIASDSVYAVGYQNPEKHHEYFWFYANCLIEKMTRNGAALDISYPEKLILDYYKLPGGQELCDPSGRAIMKSGFGVSYAPLGVTVGRGAIKFRMLSMSAGQKNVSTIRKCIRKSPELLPRVIGEYTFDPFKNKGR